MGSKQTKSGDERSPGHYAPDNIYLNTSSLQRPTTTNAIVKRKISHSSVSSSSSNAANNAKWRHSATNGTSPRLPPPLITQMAYSPRTANKYDHYRDALATGTAGQLRPVIAKPMSNRTNQQPLKAKNAEAHYQEHQQPPKNSKFGLSPRVKRKIVDVLAKTTNAATNQLAKGGNSKSTSKSGKLISSLFTNSKVFHALQAQFNIFQSLRLITRRPTQSGETLLSVSQSRNSLRYASRRKYKTQSLKDPFRHGNVNYPVYTHESLFMPEFSVKGEVTEADFEILDVISRGAFGHVIKVRRKNPEAQVYAMKIMWKSQIVRDRALQQVKDEVTIASAISGHPFVVNTWFYWQSKRFLYIITSYVDNGEMLSLWLRMHRFPERLVALYAIEMSLVLDYLHAQGIIYRDIKMENILLDPKGHIQLIDFGLSKWLKLGEKTTTICGTIQYMGPEILSVEPYTHAVDWWSLGILIYALLKGEYPLSAAKDHIQMCDKVNRHRFELDADRFSAGACGLVARLLKKNPRERLKSLSEMKKEAFVGDEAQRFYGEMGVSRGVDFWDAESIMKHYSPFQMLFDELSAQAKRREMLNEDELEYIEDDDDDVESDSLMCEELNVPSSQTMEMASSSNSGQSRPANPLIRADEFDEIDKSFRFFDD